MMVEIMEEAVLILQTYREWGYTIVFLASLFESLAFVGLIFPGGNFTVIVGMLTAFGFFDLWLMIIVATLGAIAGDMISFYLGKRASGLFKKEGRFLNSANFKRGTKFFARHGGKSVFTGRFVGPIRPIIPFVAGVFGMNFDRFMIYNVTSALVWSALYLGVGYFGGWYWQILDNWILRSTLFVFPFLMVIVVGWIVGRAVKDSE